MDRDAMREREEYGSLVGEKRKRPEPLLRGGGYSKREGSKGHRVPNVTRDPPQLTNMRGGVRRVLQSVQPARTAQPAGTTQAQENDDGSGSEGQNATDTTDVNDSGPGANSSEGLDGERGDERRDDQGDEGIVV